MNNNEYEKMLSGDEYYATDKALMTLRLQAKQQCFEINQCAPQDLKKRKRLLSLLLPNAKGLWAEMPFYCDYGRHIVVRGSVFANHNVTILDGAEVTFGNNCLIGPNTVIAATSHSIDHAKRSRGICISKSIKIGKDVWIGANVTILGGIEIGDGAIIGAGTTIRNSVTAGETITSSN